MTPKIKPVKAWNRWGHIGWDGELLDRTFRTRKQARMFQLTSYTPVVRVEIRVVQPKRKKVSR